MPPKLRPRRKNHPPLVTISDEEADAPAQEPDAPATEDAAVLPAVDKTRPVVVDMPAEETPADTTEKDAETPAVLPADGIAVLPAMPVLRPVVVELPAEEQPAQTPDEDKNAETPSEDKADDEQEPEAPAKDTEPEAPAEDKTTEEPTDTAAPETPEISISRPDAALPADGAIAPGENAGISVLLPGEGSIRALDSIGVATIGGTTYATLDEAVSAAKDGDTIQVIEDAETEGLNLSKNLTIEGVSKTTKTTDADGNEVETTVKPKLTFTKNGIALWGKSLTFRNMQVLMEGVGSTPYSEWGWMTICASRDSSLTLDNTDMVLDGAGTSNKHAIYFTGNDKLNVKNGSTLTIKNYGQDALEWDGGDGGYNLNIEDSTVDLDHNRSGIAGTFYITVDNSTLNVTNNRGNGSNGSHFDIKNGSKVNFSGNGSHGLSAGKLDVTGGSTVTANDNGYIGIAVGQTANITDSTVTANNNGWMGMRLSKASRFTNSNITIKGTKGTSYWNSGIRLFKDSASLTVDGGTLTIADNAVTGIFCDAGSTLTFLDNAKVTITGNRATQENCSDKQDLAQSGGGLVVRSGASAVLGKNTIINNNAASEAGADIFVEADGKLTFSVGNGGIGDTLDKGPDDADCGHKIDGWYIDANGNRWNFDVDADAAQAFLDSLDSLPEGTTVEKNADGTYTITAGPEGFALKAAHAELPVDPDPTPDPDPKPTPDPVTPENPENPPVDDATPDETPVTPETPETPPVQDAVPDGVSALPKTGVNWLTALAMALSGLALTAAGAFTSLFAKSRH